MSSASLPAPPPRPAPWEERAALFLLRSLAPRVPEVAQPAPPEELAPAWPLALPRRGRPGTLAATWYPARAAARGAVLLVHPWLEWGQSYFHRRGRIEALREAGHSVLTFDLGGFGGSAPPAGLWDRDVEDALAALAAQAPGLPLHVWGVSSGGYWTHMVLARGGGARVQGAMFEDVSPHLIEWSWHTAPAGRFFYGVFRRLLPRAYAYLDLRRHAPFLNVRAAAYAGGGRDRGIPPDDTRRLAELAEAEVRIVEAAGHLAAIKGDQEGLVELALRTFRQAEAGRTEARPTDTTPAPAAAPRRGAEEPALPAARR